MPIGRFPFRHIGRTALGDIWRPYAVVQVATADGQEWIPVEMVVDSGADYTLLPKRYAALVGIDVNLHCVPQTTQGVGGAETVHLYRGLKVKLGGWSVRIPAGFLERDDVPALLGRLGFLEIRSVTFAKRVTIIR